MPADVRGRVVVRLLDSCDNECIFCGLHGAPELAPLEPDALVATLGAESARGHDEVTFVGGEPTGSALLLEAIVAARAAGFARVGVQTHARRLAEPGFASALAKGGLTDVHVSLHAAEAPAHDFHTGIEGSFAAALEGIDAARAVGLTVVASTVLTRSNYRVINDLPRLLGSHGIAAWCVWVPRVAGRASELTDRVVPRLAIALPSALQAIDGALKRRIPAWIAGAPLCLLGPFASVALMDGPRAYGAVCDGCPSRARCSGVDAWYLARFGGDELIARNAAASSDAHPELRRMFVGPGRLAVPTSERREPSADGRRGLPVVK